MDELPIETRSRSRSKTPFLRSSCDHELCTHFDDDDHEHHHHHKKSPILNKKHKQISTIIEEETDTKRPQSPSKRQPLRTTKSSVTKISSTRTTSDYSSNSSEDLSTNADITPTPSETAVQFSSKNQKQNYAVNYQKQNYAVNNQKQNYAVNNQIQNYGVNNQKSSTVVTTTRVIERVFTNGRSSINQRLNKSKEMLQNESNSAFEENSKIKTSTPILSMNQFNQKKTSKLIDKTEESFNDDNSDPSHQGYQEYITAGEYWKKYPKTDYTYSKLSPHRRELAPGVVAFPNMSRKSLEKYNERINFMIERNPEQAESIRKRFVQTLFTRSQRKQDMDNTNQLLYDSQDETDLYETDLYNNYRNVQQESFIRRFITRIVTIFSSVTSVFTGKDKVDHAYLSRTGIHHNQGGGIWTRSKNAITRGLYSIFRSVYLLISSVLYLDTWLLRSSNPDGRKRKRFLLLLLILLPLLLLTAWRLLDERERNLLISRYHNFIPFSLIGLRNTINNLKTGVNNYNFDFGLPSFPSFQLNSGDNNYATITNNLKNSLSPEDYENLINHINIYVEKNVDDKMNLQRQKRDANISPEITSLIVNLIQEQLFLYDGRLKNINENIEIHKTYKLTSEDIDRIIAQLQIKLTTIQYPGPIVFTKENLDEISKLIQSKIEINNHVFNVIEKINIDELLLKILKSPNLAEFIDSRILLMKPTSEDLHSKIEAGLLMAKKEKDSVLNQQNLINELNGEISFIKTTLAEKLSENNDLHYSISLLQNAQNEIAERLKLHEINTNGRFDSLLLEIQQGLVNLENKQFESINRQIKLNLIEILGYSTNEKINGKINLDEIDLKNWIRNMFVAKAFLEERLIELNLKIDGNIKDEIDKSGVILFKDISEKLKTEILKTVEIRHKEFITASRDSNLNIKATDLDEKEIKRIVRSVLAVYDADKTGMVDFALESAGGQVLSTRCTENYHVKSAQISLFGFPLWYPSNTPRIAIMPSVQPGECWAFQGFPGFLVLKLNTMIFVSGFSIEHIPKSLAPSGNIDSAPKNFTVWGLDRENDDEPVLFGEYEYSDEGSALQYFTVQDKNINRPFEIIELRIETNHGNMAYTCLYRFRVHGKTSKT